MATGPPGQRDCLGGVPSCIPHTDCPRRCAAPVAWAGLGRAPDPEARKGPATDAIEFLEPPPDALDTLSVFSRIGGGHS